MTKDNALNARGICLLASLLAVSFLFSGCSTYYAPQEHSVNAVPLSPIDATAPGISTNIGTGETGSPETSTMELPTVALQTITPENIRQIDQAAILEDTGYFVYSGILSSNGELMAGSNKQTVEVYEVTSGNKKAVFSTTGTAYLSFSDDGSRLAAWYGKPWPAEEVVLWGDKSGNLDPVTEEKTLTVWNLETKAVVFSKDTADICGNNLSTQLFQFIQDGRLVLANLDFDAGTQNICFLSAEDGSLLNSMNIEMSYGYIRQLALSSDGQIAAVVFSSTSSGYENPTLILFACPNAEILMIEQLSEMPDLAFVPDSHTLAVSATDEHIVELMNADGTLAGSIQLPDDVGKISSLHVNAHYLAVENELDEVIVYSLKSGAEIERIALIPPAAPFYNSQLEISFKNVYTNIAAEADRLLVTQYYQGLYGDTVKRVIELGEPSKEILRLETPPPIAFQSDLSPDGSLIVMGGLPNGETRLWSTDNFQRIRTLQGHKNTVTQAAFSPDGSTLATVSADGTARLWNTSSWDCTHTLSGHSGWVLQSAFSPDGAMLLTSGTDKTIRLWDVTTGEEKELFENPLPEGLIDGIWFTSVHTALLTLSFETVDQCKNCPTRSFLLDTNTGVYSEQPWPWLKVFEGQNGLWLLNYGVYPDYRISIGTMLEGQFQVENEFTLTSITNSDKIGISADGQWIYTINLNGINLINRFSGEQVDLAANHLCRECSNMGFLIVDPDGSFLLDNTMGSLVVWGVSE